MESKAHEIRTTLKRRWIFKRASGNRCLHDASETRPPRKAEAAAAAAAIPCQYIREESQSTEKERILRENKIRTTIPGLQTCRKHSLKILIFKYVYFDTMVDFTMKKREQRFGMLYFQYWERVSVQDSIINWKENSSVRMFVSLPEPQKLQIWKLGDIRAIRRPWANYFTKNSLQLYNSSIPCIEHEIITPLKKLDWKLYGRCTHSYRRNTTLPLQWEVYNLSRQQCQRSRSNCRYKEIEEGESSNSLTTKAKCKILNFLVRNAETNFGRQSLSHHYVPVSTLKECVVKVVKENEENVVRKTTDASEGPDETLRNTWGPSGNRE